MQGLIDEEEEKTKEDEELSSFIFQVG